MAVWRLALRELEAAAGLGAAVLLALDDARVAGQEAFALDRRAQRRLVAGQRLGDAVLDRAGLARQAAALDGGDDVILAVAVGDVERLVDDQAQRRASEIDFLVAAVDDDLARARLQPDARDGVLAAAGRIGAALLVELLLAKQRLDLRAWSRPEPEPRAGVGASAASVGGRSFGCRGLGDCRSFGLRAGQRAEIGKGSSCRPCYAPTLFLRFIAATSRGSGFWPPCGCSVPL